MQCNTLICTVGTSLFSNLNRLEEGEPLRIAYNNRDLRDIVSLLLEKDASENICGVLFHLKWDKSVIKISCGFPS